MPDTTTLTAMMTKLNGAEYASVVDYVNFLIVAKEKNGAHFGSDKEAAFQSFLKFKGKIHRDIDAKKERLEALDEKYARVY